MTTGDPSVIVYSGSILEADLLRSLLDGEGIDSYLKDEFVGTLAPYVMMGTSTPAVKVVISQEDLERARPIVEEYTRDSRR